MTVSRFSQSAHRLSGEASAAWAVQDEAVARSAAGEPIIFLTVGDPDQATPRAISDQAMVALRMGRTRYSPVPGEPLLRRAVAKRLSLDSGRATASDEVVIFPGAQSALFAVMAMISGPGDEVIVAEPYYATYPGVLSVMGATLVPAPFDSRSGFSFNVQVLLERVTPRTRAVLFSSPNNPTGAMVMPADLKLLAELSRRSGIWMIADEVYSSLVYDGPHTSAWAIGDTRWTVVLNSMSKKYAMTGWRLGWAASPPDLAAHLTNFAAAAQFGCTQFVQDAAAHTLLSDLPEAGAMRSEYKRRRDFITHAVESIPELRVLPPAGGMFVMLDVRSVQPDDVAFSFALLRATGVAVIPGSGFGASAKGHVRVSLTQPIEALEKAFAAIKRFVAL